MPASLSKRLRDECHDNGLNNAAIVNAVRGGQSICFVIQSGSTRLVLKVFASQHDFNSARTAREEFEALQVFHKALPEDDRICAPQPLALFEGDNAFLMTFVEGEDIDAFMGRRLYDSTSLNQTAAVIVDGLRLYHGVVGREFGDCHPGNFLMREPDAVTFIDPASPDPLVHDLAATAEGGLLAADLGYWTAAVALNIPLELRTAARLPVNRLRLTRRMLGYATVGIPEPERARFLRSVFSVSERHVRRMMDAGSPKEKLLGLISLQVLGMMESSTSRRILRE